MGTLKKYNRHANPLWLNNPKDSDYHALYETFFDFHDGAHDKITELEQKLERCREVNEFHLRYYKDMGMNECHEDNSRPRCTRHDCACNSDPEYFVNRDLIELKKEMGW